MSDFIVEEKGLPRIVDQFSRRHGRSIRSGQAALAISHPSGKWSTSYFITPLNETNVKILGTWVVEGVPITLGETTSKGSTVLADGQVENWVRPSVAYYAPVELDSLGDGQHETGTVYLIPFIGAKPITPPPKRDHHAMAVQRAQQEVERLENNLLMETKRAAAVMKYCGATQDEADQIIEEADELLDEAQRELMLIMDVPTIAPKRSRYDVIREALSTYTGPLNKKGRPRRKPFRIHASMPDIYRRNIDACKKSLMGIM